MNETIPLRTRRLTAEEVLVRLRALAAFLSDGPSIELDTTVAQFCARLALDDETPLIHAEGRALASVLEATCGARINDWRDVLLPAKVRTLRDVCEHVAANTDVVVPEPVTILGRPCLSAGAFLAVRTLLREAGADVENLGPSSPLEPYLRGQTEVFRRDISWLLPPTVLFLVPDSARRSDGRLLGLAVLCAFGFMVALLGFLVAAASRSATGVVIATPFLAATLYGVFASYKASQWFVRQIELPGLHNFRDLINAILNRPPRHTANPETMS